MIRRGELASRVFEGLLIALDWLDDPSCVGELLELAHAAKEREPDAAVGAVLATYCTVAQAKLGAHERRAGGGGTPEIGQIRVAEVFNVSGVDAGALSLLAGIVADGEASYDDVAAEVGRQVVTAVKLVGSFEREE